ncbi:MAG: sulfotransferase domain-containing protein [Bacteroidota bacterium]
MGLLQPRQEVDAFIVSYPKCGRTWLRVMLAKYVQEAFNIPDFTPGDCKKRYDILNVRFSHDQGNWVPAPIHASKIHTPSTKFYDYPLVFVVRDPRDVLVSSYMHLRYREKLYKGSISEFIRDKHVGIEKIVNFFNVWAQILDQHSRCLCVSYEDMQKAPSEQFENILRTIGITDIDLDALRKAVSFSSFENMKRMEATGKGHSPWLQAGDTKDERTYKTRKGKIGDYLEHLEKDDIEFLDRLINQKLSAYFQQYHCIRNRVRTQDI